MLIFSSRHHLPGMWLDRHMKTMMRRVLRRWGMRSHLSENNCPKGYKTCSTKAGIRHSSPLEYLVLTSSIISLIAMVFKLTVGLLALAATVSAASIKRVACPDGKHTTTHEACCVFFDLADFLVTEKFDSTCGEDGGSIFMTFFQGVCTNNALQSTKLFA